MRETRDELKVLFIGESLRGFSHIASRLENSGCRCQFVKSYDEARQSLRTEVFDLVLSVAHPRDNAISSLADLLSGTRASIFYALPVEESCWWLPALRQGKHCLGTPALRPSEFASVLDEVVAKTRASRQAALKTPAPRAKTPEEGFSAAAAAGAESAHKAHHA